MYNIINMDNISENIKKLNEQLKTGKKTEDFGVDYLKNVFGIKEE